MNRLNSETLLCSIFIQGQTLFLYWTAFKEKLFFILLNKLFIKILFYLLFFLLTDSHRKLIY
jgi:hypothetical protein